MSSRQSGALRAVEVMLNGSLIRLNNLKGENREALYDEYKEWLEVDDDNVIIENSDTLGYHFSPAYLEYSDNPYLAMNIYVTSAVLNDLDLETGDEIGVFDGDVCVGMGIVEGTISTTNILSIAVSFQDASWPANTGFSSGNTISYRYWDASASSEVSSIETTYLQGSDTFAQQSSYYVSLIGSGEGTVIYKEIY